MYILKFLSYGYSSTENQCFGKLSLEILIVA